jgi:hypothetical protein
MRILSTILLLTTLIQSLNGQIITGRIIDLSNGSPLEYASIGAIGTSAGCVTDREGKFNIDVTNLPKDIIIRASMISYHSQTFTIDELSKKDIVIALHSAPIQLEEVVIRPLGKIKKIGIFKNSDVDMGLWGWVGIDLAKGRERGSIIKLGKKPVRLLSLNLNLYFHSFDTSILRLHIRKIEKGLPTTDLLLENILLPVTAEEGWVDFDLSNYNLQFNGDIAVTLEWVKAIGIQSERKQKYQRSNKPRIFFYIKTGKGNGLFVKEGVENKWVHDKRINPCFYLTVQELQK